MPRPEQTPRIGYVLKMYPRFSETFVVSEILAREEVGHDLHVFSLRYPVDGRFHATLADVRAEVTYLPHARLRTAEVWSELAVAARQLPRLPAVLPELLRADVSDAMQALHLAREVRARGITHLHAHFASVATTVARLASLLTGVPYSFTAHAKDLFHESVDPEDLRAKLRDAATAVTVTDYNASYLRAAFPDEAARVVTVRNGLLLDDFPFTSPVGREPVVAAVGRLVEKKGFCHLLEAVALLRDRGRPVRTVLAGAGPSRPSSGSSSTPSAWAGWWTCAGRCRSTRSGRWCPRAAVLAAPCVTGTDGNADGLPTVLLEAMALGTPVVATPVTGIPELVRHGETGLLVPERDPRALADALATLLDDQALGAGLALQGRAVVERGLRQPSAGARPRGAAARAVPRPPGWRWRDASDLRLRRPGSAGLRLQGRLGARAGGAAGVRPSGRRRRPRLRATRRYGAGRPRGCGRCTRSPTTAPSARRWTGSGRLTSSTSATPSPAGPGCCTPSTAACPASSR